MTNENQEILTETAQSKISATDENQDQSPDNMEEEKIVEEEKDIAMSEIDDIINSFEQSDDDDVKILEHTNGSEFEEKSLDAEFMPLPGEKTTHADKDFQRAKEDMKDSLELEDLFKKQRVKEIREKRVHLKEKIKKLNPYAYNANQKSIERARAIASNKGK